MRRKKKNDDFAYEYSYDENGNRINRQLIDQNGPQYGVDYSYDPENRLVLAQDYQIVGGSKKEANHRIDRAFTTMEYDGGGRRLVQHYDPKQGGNGVDKRDEYVFDGLDPVAEYNMLNGQHTDYYRGAGNHLALMHHYKGGTQGQMYWYHYNNKGDVVGLTKHNGNSHHNYRYDPYGAVLPENGNFTDPHNHYTLTGKEFDENTGLVWFGARHYEPETGVWMGQDSYRGRLSSPGTLHRFGYVGNNPVSYWDWYGFLDCPNNSPTSDPQWIPYYGNSKIFHCGFDGYIEDREGNGYQKDPIGECFYDGSGMLVTEIHEYGRCMGTPNDYYCDANNRIEDWEDCLNHTINDKGGIVANGLDAWVESRGYYAEKKIKCIADKSTRAWYNCC